MSNVLKKNDASIIVSVVEQITFASQQNDVAVISELIVRNTTDEAIENLTLQLVSSPEALSERTWTIDRISPQSEIRLTDRKITLSASMLQGLTERLSVNVDLSLFKDEEVIAKASKKLTLLARNEWGGSNTMPELLAAFVMPNDEAVENLLKRSSEVLRRAGEQPALNGYQSKSRKRVYTIVSAIWSALASKQLSYAEPPASFELSGQKMRTPSQIWEKGLATCLDTTALFASALEQAGIYPVVAFTKGHAFCGAWLQPQYFPSLTIDDCVEVRKHIAAKELVLFETTLVTNHPPATFHQAVKRGADQLTENVEQNFVYAIDIKQARQRGISPLPSFEANHLDKEVGAAAESVDLALDAAPDLPAFDFGLELEADQEETPQTRLDKWRRKLLDLTKRNRLLNLKTTKTSIKLHCPNPALLEDHLADGDKITVIPKETLSGDQGERDPTLFLERTGKEYLEEFAAKAMERSQIVADLDERNLEKGMIELYRKSKADIREGGANTLFLAIGVLRWKQTEDDSRSYKAPLLLVPVKLERKSARSKVKIVIHDDEPVFNMTLLEMLRQDFEVSIPQLEGELPTDDSGVDVPLIWEIVRRKVKEIPGFEVQEEVFLSTFSFAKYLMWKDLSDRTETLKKSSLVKHLIDSPRDPYDFPTEFVEPKDIDSKLDLSKLFMPLPADSSQIVAINASGENSDFILEGPPGTGKSQTIANIIAHNLALGKKVLFVSEKMAALEVVYSRLKTHGLGDFCLELHSNKTNKKAVIDHLGHSWKSRERLSADEWHRETGKLSSLRDELNALVSEIHRPSQSGISPYRAIGRASRYHDAHRISLDWEGDLTKDPIKSQDEYNQYLDLVADLSLAYKDISDVDTSSLALIENTEWSYAWQGDVVKAALDLNKLASILIDKVRAFQETLGVPDKQLDIQETKNLQEIIYLLPQAERFDLSLALDGEADAKVGVAKNACDTLVHYRGLSDELSVSVQDDFIPTINVKELQQNWDESKNSFSLLKIFKQFFISSRLKKEAGKVKLNPESDLPLLAKLQKCVSLMKELKPKLDRTLPWSDLKTDVQDINNRLDAISGLKTAIAKNANNIDDLINVKKAVQRSFIEGRELLQEGMGVRKAADHLSEALCNFEKGLRDFSYLASTDDYALSLQQVVDKTSQILDLQPHLNAWCRWQSVKRDALAKKLVSIVEGLEAGNVVVDQAKEAFVTAYSKWLAPRLIDSRDALRTFSSLSHEEKIAQFRNLDEKVSELSVDYIRAKLSGDMPSPEDKDRPKGYGVLQHEMNKQRAHKPVRQLVSEMGDVLTSLTPCMLMSPLSIAQFLPAETQLFDLVVFDEASQITVWDAVGAIARGKNVIVVGDPKQMPPTNFFDRAADDEDDDDNAMQDLESILEEAMASGVKLHRLTGHYRSRHESLIAFSNHAYYGGDLITYPSCNTKESAVTFVKVEDGLYQRGKRTNANEAKAVVAEIVRRLTDAELNKLSIGVVTMNTEQQRLINDLLDVERRKNPELEPFFGDDNPDHVFVRNLETVQGDERNVILISISFGPTEPGAKTMSMSFGALNRKGGERRLNVLITRASEAKMVFCSFEPSMIDLTRTSSRAVSDLKHYLDFAQRGPKALGEAVHSTGGLHAYDSDFERAVADGLRLKGWNVQTQIGVSKFRVDLGVVHPDKPGEYLAGIECDGATYHSLPAARDRDRVRHVILENLGWRLLRLWSTDYFLSPQLAIDNLSAKLDDLVKDDEIKQAELEKESAAIAEVIEEHVSETNIETAAGETFDDDQFLKKTVNNVIANHVDAISVVDEAGSLQLDADSFYDDHYRNTIRKMAEDIISQQAPITFKYLADCIARAHGFKRTARRIKSVVYESIKGLCLYVDEPDSSKTIWPAGAEVSEVVNFRGQVLGGASRTWQDIPYPERKGMAIIAINKSGNDKAPETMAKMIGLKRLASTTRDDFESVIDNVSEENILQ